MIMETNTIRRTITTFLTDRDRLTSTLEDILKLIKSDGKKKGNSFTPALSFLEMQPFAAIQQEIPEDGLQDGEIAPQEQATPSLNSVLTALRSDDQALQIRALRHVLSAFAHADAQALKHFIVAEDHALPLMLNPALFTEDAPALKKEEVTLIRLIMSLMLALNEQSDEQSAPETQEDRSFSYETALSRYLDVILASNAKKLTTISISPYLSKLTHGKADSGVSPSFVCEKALREQDAGTNFNRADDLRQHVSTFSFPSTPTLSASAQNLSALWLIRDIKDEHGVPLLDVLRNEPEGDVRTFLNSDPDRAAQQLAEVRNGIFGATGSMTSDSLLKQVYVPDTTEHHGSAQPFFLVQPCWSDELWERLSGAQRRAYAQSEKDVAHGKVGKEIRKRSIIRLAIGGSNPQNISTRIAKGGNALLSCAPPSYERKSDLLSTFIFRVRKILANLAIAHAKGGFHNRNSVDRSLVIIAKVFARLIADNENYNAIKNHGSATLTSDVIRIIKAYRGEEQMKESAGKVTDFRDYHSVAAFTLSQERIVDSALIMKLSQAMANRLNKVGV